MSGRRRATKATKNPPTRDPAIARRETFILEYLVDQNATRAAVAAGFSEKTARQQASRMLSDVNVQQEIHARLAKRFDRLEISGQRVLQEIARIAFITDEEHYVTSKLAADSSDVTLYTSRNWLIANATVKDKIKCLELLGKWKDLMLFKDSLEVTGDKSTSDAFKEAMSEVRFLIHAVGKERK